MADIDTHTAAEATAPTGRRTTPDESKPELTRFAWLSLLRAYGVVLVLVYHFYPEVLPAGFLGVDVFFVFSGYLISSLLIRESLTTGHISLLGFYRRRVRRLLPAVAFMLLTMLPLSLLISPDFRVGIAQQTAATLGWVTNFYEIANGQSYAATLLPHLFVHTWTLSVEMQYYLLWGAVLCLILPTSVLMARGRDGAGRKATDRDAAGQDLEDRETTGPDVEDRYSVVARRAADRRRTDARRSAQWRNPDARRDPDTHRGTDARHSPDAHHATEGHHDGDGQHAGHGSSGQRTRRDSVNARRLRVVVSVALAGAALSFIAMQVLFMNADDPSPAYFNTLSHLYPLLIGSAVGAVAGFPRSFLVRFIEPKRPAVAVAVVVVCLLGITAIARFLSFENPLTYHAGILLTSVLVATVIIVGRGMQGRLARHTEPRLPLYLANVSYSLYLFHWPLYIIIGQWGQGLARSAPAALTPVIVNGAAILALALTFAFAHLSYRLVEQPFSASGQGLSQSLSALRAMIPPLIPRLASRLIARLTSSRLAAQQDKEHKGDGGFCAIDKARQSDAHLTAQKPPSPLCSPKPPPPLRSPLLSCCLVIAVLLVGCVGALWSAPIKTSIERDYQQGLMALDVSQLDRAHATISQLTQGGEDVTVLMPDNISIIGDSVTLDAAGPIQEATGAYIDGSVGRSMRQGVSLIAEMEQGGLLREYVVIALATNTHADSLDAAYEIIANMAPGHRLVFVTSFGVGNHDMDELSAALRTLPDEFPFVTVADWNAAIADKEYLLAPDGYHCADPESVEIYTQLVLDALQEAGGKPTT
jgi:peptidoglycan/LPS O-acetylase OafA/YrhL